MIALPPVLFDPAPALVADQGPGRAEVWHQVGPNPNPPQPSALPIPRHKRDAAAPAPAAAPKAPAEIAPTQRSRFSECLATAQRDPAGGLAAARAWLGEDLTGEARVAANVCLGQILTQQGDFAGAETAFGDAVVALPASAGAVSAPLLAMAGNAALAAGRAAQAADWFDKALAVPGQTDNAARGAIAIDRARALVADKRLPEASGALEEAHRLVPEAAEGWLLSATLARRGGDLDRAQRDIEVAAGLAPRDPANAPAIGLEAGVIAMLSGREAAARKSWESVVASAPGSAEATTARGYLDQIGAAPTSGSQTPAAPPPEPRP